MIIRIVKMTFEPSKTEEFLKNFNASKEKIRGFPGCERLELLRDKEEPNIFFTYSYWRSPMDLEKYRRSEIFRSTWAKTKPLFAASPEAWSVERVDEVSPSNDRHGA